MAAERSKAGETGGGGERPAETKAATTRKRIPREAVVQAVEELAQDATAETPGATAARFLRSLHAPGDVFETRLLHCPAWITNGKPGRLGTWSGHYLDPDQAAADAVKIDGSHKPVGCYVTANPTSPDLLARGPLGTGPKDVTTQDDGIARRRWLPVDLDPERQKGIAATDAERTAALDQAALVVAEMTAAGWPAPMRVGSGNGALLLWRVELPNDADSLDLITRVLAGMGARFDTSAVHVDKAMCNAARIIRLPGTWNRKGTDFKGAGDIPARPWRIAELLDVPADLVPVSRELLEAVATPKPAAIPARATTPPRAPQGVLHAGPTFDRFDPTPAGVRSYLERHGVPVTRPRADGDGTMLDLLECPIAGSAGGTSVSVRIGAGGLVTYHNLHNGGSGLTWADVRDHLEPGYRAHSERMKGRGDTGNPFGPLPGATTTASESAAPGAIGENETGEPQPHPWADLRVTFEHFATTQPDPPEWLVPGLLEVGSLGVVYGAPSSLKSMIVLDLAVAVASGGGWLPGIPGDYATAPRETPRRKVLWIDMDNGRRRSHERMHAFAAGHGVSAADFSYYAFPPLDLANEESAALLFDLIRAEGAALVILDTFVNSTSVKSENDNAELRGPLLRLRKIVDALGCCILVIHHSNKAAQWGAAQRNMRGGSAIAGALDLALEVTRQSPQGDLIAVTATKERSAPIPEFFARWTFEHNLVGGLESCRFFGVEHSRGAKDDDVCEEDRSEEILEFLRTNGSTTARQILDHVKGRRESASKTIKRLVKSSDIVETPRKGKGGGMTLSLPALPAAPPAPVDPGQVWTFLEKVGARTLPKIAEQFETSEAAVMTALDKLGTGLPDGRKVTSKSGKAGRKYAAVPWQEGGADAPASA